MTSIPHQDVQQDRQKRSPAILRAIRWTFFAIALAALLLRLAGVWRGIDDEVPFHPDVPKQLHALEHYMNGRYVFYVHNRFYDGYPLFLEHVDEWIIRPTYALYRHAHDWMSPDTAPLPIVPPFLTLYRVSRLLRVLYGMLAVLLVYPIARTLSLRPPLALLAMAISAFSPLAITVAHFASGDIGCDLFIILTIAALCRHVKRPRAIWLILAGVLSAFAFASKYNGGLAVLIVAIYITSDALPSERGARRFARGGALAAGAFFIGAVIAIPQLLTDTERTISLITKMTQFIRIYAVPAEVLSLSPVQQSLYSFQHNSLPLWRSLGWFTLPLALGTVVPLLLSMRLRLAEGAHRQRALCVAIALFVPGAMFVALAGKPVSQPFHFSYLVGPIALCTALSLSYLAQASHRALRIAVPLLALLCLAEHALPAFRNSYFWRRDDVETVTKQLLHDPPLPGLISKKYRLVERQETLIRQLVIERAPVSHFRNRPRSIISPDGPHWQKLHVLPLPPVSARQPNPWVFLNGPALPRNDRVLPLLKDRTLPYELVTHQRPQSIEMLLQAGATPVEIHLAAGGAARTAMLAPHQALWIELTPKHIRKRLAPAGLDTDTIWVTPLRATAHGGNAWVSIVNHPLEREVLDAFHMGQPQALVKRAETLEAGYIAGLLCRTHYLHGRPENTRLDASSRRNTSVDLDLGQTGLAAGCYILEADIVAFSTTNSVQFALSTPRGDNSACNARRDLSQGLQSIRIPFEKPLQPYECRVSLSATQGQLQVLQWSIQPDFPALWHTFAALRRGETPNWTRRDTVPLSDAPPLAEFSCGTQLLSLNVPQKTLRGEPLTCEVVLRLKQLSAPPNEQVVFLHMHDSERRRVHTRHIPLSMCAIEGGPERAFTMDLPEELPPGHYTVDLGMWNSRTEKRIALSMASAEITVRRNRLQKVASFTLATE